MTQVSITEFRNNIKKYSILAQIEDLEIVNRGETLFYVKGKKNNRKEAISSLIGCVKTDADFDEVMEQRIKTL